MKNKIFGAILGVFTAIAIVAFAEGIPQKFGATDILQVGKTSSVDDKEIIFNTGDGAGNTKLFVDDTNQDLHTNANTLFIGDGIDLDKVIVALNGDVQRARSGMQDMSR